MMMLSATLMAQGLNEQQQCSTHLGSGTLWNCRLWESGYACQAGFSSRFNWTWTIHWYQCSHHLQLYQLTRCLWTE